MTRSVEVAAGSRTDFMLAAALSCACGYSFQMDGVCGWVVVSGRAVDAHTVRYVLRPPDTATPGGQPPALSQPTAADLAG